MKKSWIKFLFGLVAVMGLCLPAGRHGATEAHAGYDQYEKVFLKWQAALKIVARIDITESGWHTVIFQAQTVNDSRAMGNAITVMITAKLFVNGEKIKGWTENVDSDRHYGNPTLLKRLYLEPGDVIEIKMRADSMREYPRKSVFVLIDPDRFQFDVTREDR